MDNLKDFRDELLKVVKGMDGVVTASVIEGTDDIVIGVELDDSETVFIQIQPA